MRWRDRPMLLLWGLIMGCAHATPAPPGALPAAGLERLYCVEHDDVGGCNVFRSSQPDRQQFEALASLFGIKTVIKLNTALPFDGQRDVTPANMELIHHPWAPLGPVSHEQIEQVLDDIDTAQKPVLIHCLHGEDRTGLAIALWRVRHGTLASSAAGEMRHYGFHVEIFELANAFKRETGEKP